jgi:hypothetical protein
MMEFLKANKVMVALVIVGGLVLAKMFGLL